MESKVCFVGITDMSGYPRSAPSSLLGLIAELVLLWVVANIAKFLANQPSDFCVYASIVLFFSGIAFGAIRCSQYLNKILEKE